MPTMNLWRVDFDEENDVTKKKYTVAATGLFDAIKVARELDSAYTLPRRTLSASEGPVVHNWPSSTTT